MTELAIEVRHVAYADPLVVPMLTELDHEYWTRYRHSLGDITEEMARRADFGPPDGGVVLLLEDGEPVAGGAFRRYDDTTAELKRIWTHSAHRRRGLARRVLEELEREIDARGYGRIYLTTGPRQPEAMALYRATGYTALYDPDLDPEVIGAHPFEKALARSRSDESPPPSGSVLRQVSSCYVRRGRPMPHPQATIHRMFELVESIGTIAFSDGVTEAFLALGMRNYWDGYFAGRAAPLGTAPAAVVHAVFYNFADGEVERHIPWVWGITTPEEAIAVRERSSAAALRTRIGALADAPGLVRAADLATRAAVSAPTEGRPLYAGLRMLDVPEEPVARLWHAATLLREHRGDSHNAVLVAHGIGGTEAHVLLALSLGERAEEFSRTHHLPAAQLAAVVEGLRDRGLVDAAGSFTDAGLETRQRIEALTDELAAAAYDVLTADELAELVAELGPIAAAM